MKTPDYYEVTTEDIVKKNKKPWWVAVITTVVMALGGASGAILNYLDNRDARRMASLETKTEGTIHTIWLKEQVEVLEKSIAECQADTRVQEVILEGMKRRVELLEGQAGRGAMRASRRIRVRVPKKEEVLDETLEALKKNRPEKRKRDDPEVQQMIQEDR